MSHKVAICQPHYIPWIGYLEMIDRVDEFVFLDDVDVIQREWKTRNRIRKECTSSDTKWLSVPIVRECRRKTPLAEALIGGDGTWRKKHLDALRTVYHGAPCFEDAERILIEGFSRESKTIADLNITLVEGLCEYLGITTPMRRATEIPTTGHKTEKLLAICERVGADDYLANNGSSDYLDVSRFEEQGIHVQYQDYEHPTYSQFAGREELPFVSHLSILDLIANHGDESLELIRQGRPTTASR
jgi:hypothetical protein